MVTYRYQSFKYILASSIVFENGKGWGRLIQRKQLPQSKKILNQRGVCLCVCVWGGGSVIKLLILNSFFTWSTKSVGGGGELLDP